jgi:hypothetical protein
VVAGQPLEAQRRKRDELEGAGIWRTGVETIGARNAVIGIKSCQLRTEKMLTDC